MNDKFAGEENLLGPSFTGRNCHVDAAFPYFSAINRLPSISLNKTTRGPSKHLPQYKLQL